MKNVDVCLGCNGITVNDIPELSMSAVVKLLIITNFHSGEIVINGYVCPNCRINFPVEYCEKLIKDISVVSS